MATGIGYGFDLSGLDKAFTNLDKKIDDFVKKSQAMEKAVTENFQNIAKNGIGSFISELDKAQKAMSKLGGAKAKSDPMKSVNDGVIQAVKHTTQFMDLMAKINNDGASSRRSSAVTKINEELEVAKKRLGELQNLLNFYAKGEGQKAIGFVDTSALQQDARALINQINLLERQKASLQANERLRMALAQRQEARDNAWAKMQNDKDRREAESAKRASQYAKQYSEDYRKSYEERYRAYEAMFDKIDGKENRRRSAKSIYNEGTTLYNSIYSENGYKSVSNMSRSIQQMRDAQSKLNLGTEEGKKKYNQLGEAIKRVEKDLAKLGQQSDNVRKKHSNLLNISEQLQRRLALAFSVSQVNGYINKLVQVRGEFELQQRALQAIVQNVDEANQIWDKTVALAVKSPFRVKELVTYTKQLAAYRIESNKLYDTTKMLADVSAGLGVDMQRLILAYGQVKAANYLRGTELRQFSEAGINMLGELSKYFTEIENRAVSVADVFDRISKRGVSFEDVDAVFKRITSEGGMFYQMQEKQAQTLKGAISNLHDSIDLMLNDIGKANEGTLKDAVQTARELVDNWRGLATVLKQVGTAILLLQLSKFAAGWRMVAIEGAAAAMAMNGTAGAAARLRVGMSGLFATMKAHPILLIVGALASAGHALWEYVEAIDAANEKYNEMSRREIRRADALDELNKKVLENNNVIKDSNAEIEDQNKAFADNESILAKIKQEYPELYSSIVTQKDGTIDLTEAIEKQNEALEVNIALQQRAKGGFWQESQGENYEDVIDAQTNLTNTIYDLREESANLSKDLTESFSKGFIKEGTYNEVKQLLAELRNAKGYDNVLSAYKKLNDYYQKNKRELKQSVSLVNTLLPLYNNVQMAHSSLLNAQKNLWANFENQFSIWKDELEKIKSENERGSWLQDQLDKLNILDKEVREWVRKELEKKVEVTIVFPEPKDDPKIATGWRKQYNDFISSFTTNTVRGIFDNTNVEQYISNLKSDYEKTSKDIAAWDAGNAKARAEYSKEEIDAIRTRNEEQKRAYDWLVYEEKNKDNKQINTQIALIKEMRKEYEKLEKTFDKTTAKEKVLTSYAESFRNAFKDVGLSLEGKIIDDEKIKELRDAGTISEEVASKIEEMVKSGSYIRTFSEDAVTALKHWEGFSENAYNIGDNRWTIGYGETKGVKEGDTITKEEAEIKLRKRLTEDFATSLNKVLDLNKDIILTQEQYNALLDLTYQGGSNAVKKLLEYSKNQEAGVAHIQNMYNKIKDVMGEREAERFGESFVNKFKETENVYERISMLLQTMNLTVRGSQIDKNLYQGMQIRSDSRASIFAYGKEFNNIFEKAAMDFSDLDVTDAKGIVDFFKKLMPYAKEQGEEAAKIVQKAIDQYEVQFGLDDKVKQDKELIDHIEDMFSNYEISLELEKLNIPSDLAKRLFGVDAIDLSAIRQKIETELNAAKAKGGQEDRVKELEQQLKKVDELEQKELKERLKRYSEFLVKGQSEAVRLKIEELRELAKLEEDYQNKRIEKTDYELAKKGIQDEYKRKQEDLVWDEFTESDTYIKMFEDLDKASTSSIRKMIKRIEDLKGSLSNLDPKNVKEMIDALEKLKDEDVERNPFRTMSENAKEWVQWLTQAIRLNKELKNAEEEEVNAQDRLNNARENYAQSSIDYEITNKDAKATKEQKDAAKARMDAAKSELKSAQDTAEKSKETADNARKTKEELREAALLFAAGLSGAGEEVQKYTDALSGLASHFSKDAGEFISGVGGGISSLLGGAGNLASGIASGNPLAMIQGASDIIGGIKNIKGAFDAMADKDNEREIQAQIKLVDKLGKQYEKLEKQIDKAYSLDTLQSAYQQSEANLEQQIAAYDKMIAAEEGKKNTDQKRIDEWKEAQEQLEEQIEELRAEAFSEATGGILDDVKSAAREWTDAWFEAFAETGDGLQGLKDNFKDVMLEMVKQQAASILTGAYIDKWKKELEQYVNADDMELTTEEAKAWSNKVREDLPQLSEALETYANAMKEAGIEIQGASELSGLQRGIQGITEDQADILAAYWNSVRMYTASIDTKMDTIIANMNVGGDENPMLPQLRIVAQQTSAINELLQSVSMNDGNGLGFRVYMP